MCNVKDVAPSNKSTDNYHPTLQSLLLQHLFWFHSQQLHCFSFLLQFLLALIVFLAAADICFQKKKHLKTA